MHVCDYTSMHMSSWSTFPYSKWVIFWEQPSQSANYGIGRFEHITCYKAINSVSIIFLYSLTVLYSISIFLKFGLVLEMHARASTDNAVQGPELRKQYFTGDRKKSPKLDKI